MSFKFSASATEFVPTLEGNNDKALNSVDNGLDQDRPRPDLKNASLHADAQEFIPRSAVASSQKSNLGVQFQQSSQGRVGDGMRHKGRKNTTNSTKYETEPIQKQLPIRGHDQARNFPKSFDSKASAGRDTRKKQVSNAKPQDTALSNMDEKASNVKQVFHQNWAKTSNMSDQSHSRRQRYPEQVPTEPVKDPLATTPQKHQNSKSRFDNAWPGLSHNTDNNVGPATSTDTYNDPTTNVMKQGGKSWRDVIISKPTAPVAKDVSSPGVIASSREHASSSLKSSEIPQLSRELNGPQNKPNSRFRTDYREENRAFDGKDKFRPDSYRHSRLNRNMQQSSAQSLQDKALPEWRQNSEHFQRNVSRQNNFQRNKPGQTRENATVLRHRNDRGPEKYRLIQVSKQASNKVKSILCNEKHEDSSFDLVRSADSSTKCRGWYPETSQQTSFTDNKNDATCDDDALCCNNEAVRAVESRSHCVQRQKTSLQRNGSNSQKNNFESSEPVSKNGIPGNMAHGQLRNTDHTTNSIVGMPVEHRSYGLALETTRHISDQPTPNSHKAEMLSGINRKEKFAASVGKEQSVASESNDVDNEQIQHDWVIVKKKPKSKSKEPEEHKFESEHTNARPSVVGPSVDRPSVSGVGKRNTVLGTTEKQRKLAMEAKKKKEATKSKQSAPKTPKKRKKKKENILYDNDQKKVKEFKMRQIIEESLKQNLLELTTPKHQNSEYVDMLMKKNDGNEDWPTIGIPDATTTPMVSYSAALKTKPSLASNTKGILHVNKSMANLTEEEQRIRKFKDKRKQKKISRKERKRAEAVTDVVETQPTYRSAITFDLGSMFDKLVKVPEAESQSKSTRKTVTSSGVIAVATGLTKKNTPHGRKIETSKGKASVNTLDSTQPLRMRGKEREKPKTKKPTLLKKVILKEREAKKLRREAEKEKSITQNEAEDCAGAVSEAEPDICEGNNLEDSVLVEQKNRPSLEKQRDEKPQSMSEEASTFKPLTYLPNEILAKIHNRKFREYCDQFLSKEIDGFVIQMLKDLKRFQTRAYIENPLKAKSKRRIVMGIREVSKHLKTKKLKCVIMAPNLERISAEGGIDHMLSGVIAQCHESMVPIVYSMSRQVIGFTLNRKVPVSAVGIFNYDGTEENYKQMMTLVEDGREKYKTKVAELMRQGELALEENKDSKALQTNQEQKNDCHFAPVQVAW